MASCDLFIGLALLLMSNGEMLFDIDPGVGCRATSVAGRRLFKLMNELIWRWCMKRVLSLAVLIAITSIGLLVFRSDGRVDRISAPFFFHDRQIEFCCRAGVFSASKLMVSYGVRDCEAWTATMDIDEVLRFIYKDAL